MTGDVDQIRLAFSPSSLMALNVILGVLMFGVALDIRVGDFKRLGKDPRGPLVGLLAQFFLLPAATFGLTLALDPHPTVALGMILVAACPGGNISNFMTFLARGNAALSVGMTAVSSTAALFMTPFNIAFWGSLNPKTASLLKSIAIDRGEMFGMVLLILGLPLVCGMFIGHRFPQFTRTVRQPLRILGAAIFVAFVVIGVKNNAAHFSGALLPIFAAVILHNALSLSLGYGVARALRLSAYDARAICIEVGIQNSGLGLVLIFNFFDGVGGMAVVAAAWGIWHIVAGLTLARIWSARPVRLPPLHMPDLPACRLEGSA
jgi:BASS family bile acid:Na+ symporter